VLPSSPGYGIREVARLAGVPAARVRSLARAGLVEPRRGARGEWRFDFRDLAFLRRVADLPATGVSPRRLRRALVRLRAWLPPERDLRELGLATAEGELVVREAGRLWNPDSGQCVFDFRERRQPAVVSLDVLRPVEPDPEPSEAERWYRLGCELERADLPRAHHAYARAVALDPAHADARINLGCLEHEAGALEAAEAQYRAALAQRPDDATAGFDLAVVLEDRGRLDEAREAYLGCLESDPDYAEAHYNLARVCEALGDDEGVVRHLVCYRRLTREE